MNILLLNQFFWPDAAATGQLLTDLARHLAEQGHQVRVICGRSVYASGPAASPPPVEMIRLPVLPFTRSLPGRLFSYVSFLAGATLQSLRGPTPDVVITLTTPPFLHVLGWFIKTVRGSRHYAWEMDIYPDVAVDLRVLRGHSWMVRTIGAVLDKARRNADGIIVLGECMRDRLLEHGLPVGLVSVAENWADSREIHPLPFPADRPFTVLHSGNFGLAHDIATIRETICRLREEQRIRFVFAGDGHYYRLLQKFCQQQGLPNVSFRPYVPRQRLAESLGGGAIGLVVQNPACLGTVVPSKVYGIMAAGRPVLFIGPRQATPSRVIGRFQCGWQVDCGDVERLTALLQDLADHPAVVSEAGIRARQAFLEHYDLPVGVNRICQILGIPSSGPVKLPRENWDCSVPERMRS